MADAEHELQPERVEQTHKSFSSQAAERLFNTWAEFYGCHAARLCPQPTTNKEKSSQLSSPLVRLSLHGELILQTYSQLAQLQEEEREAHFRKSSTILPCSACSSSQGRIAPSHHDPKGLHQQHRHATQHPTHFGKQLVLLLSPKNQLLPCPC